VQMAIPGTKVNARRGRIETLPPAAPVAARNTD